MVDSKTKNDSHVCTELVVSRGHEVCVSCGKVAAVSVLDSDVPEYSDRHAFVSAFQTVLEPSGLSTVMGRVNGKREPVRPGSLFTATEIRQIKATLEKIPHCLKKSQVLSYFVNYVDEFHLKSGKTVRVFSISNEFYLNAFIIWLIFKDRGTITNKKAVQDILKFIKGKYWILVIIKTHKCYQNNEQYEDTAQ